MKLELATRWEVKVNGSEKSIQLYDATGKELNGDEARWEGNFYCSYNQLTSLSGAPRENTDNCEGVIDLISAKLRTKGILLADGIMAHILSDKNNIFKIRSYGKKETSYCIYRDGQFSHGKTIKEAIESLRYKISNRDTSEYESWKLTTKKPIAEMIQAYRKITGACEFGVREFISSHNISETLTVEEVVKITVGSYGNKEFEKFFKQVEKLKHIELF